MKNLSLCGSWQMTSTNKELCCTANVPGSDFGNLIRQNKIKNPLFSGIEEEALKIAENDFAFLKQFDVTEDDLKYSNAHFQCDAIDTLCTGFVNGKKAFELNNAFVSVDVDIKPYLTVGTNTLELKFASAYNYIVKKQAEDKMPANNNGVNGIPHIRKPGCHFGWDWGPCVPYNYVGNALVSFYNEKIENLEIHQNTTKEKAVVTYSANGVKEGYLLSPTGEKILPDGNKFEILNPILWYTRDLSEKDTQPLYSLVLSNDEMTLTKKIGLRSIVLNTEKDAYGSNFQFVVNGEKIFAKGANLIPFAAIPEDADDSTVDYYLELAAKSNFNVIRVWGGGSYASEYLLSRCDELGLLIWQDFCFACQLYPFYNEEFLNNVLNEVKSNVTRISTHPSLALWCGNNEAEAMFGHLPKSMKCVTWYEKFFYNILPEYIKDLTDTPYIPSSPVGTAPFKDCSADGVGDTHMWNVWHGLKPLNYYQQRYSRFLSEFGLESLPSMKAIKTFASPENFSLQSKEFLNHQKCTGGNQKMMFYLTEMFDFPKSFEDLPYLTGIVQAQCIKKATEHFRQNKGRCNGSVFWQYNDVWNAPSWSSVDFEKVPKALQYKSKEFFAPVALSFKNSVLYAHNDTLFDKKSKLTVKILQSDDVVSTKEIDVLLPANSVKKIGEFNLSANQVIYAKWDFGTLVDFEKSPKLKKADFEIKTSGNLLTIKSDTFARDVYIECDGIANDNYFSLIKGESKTISFDKEPKNVSIKCVNNIEFKKGKIKKALFRFFYRLKPLNIANAFYYQYN